MNRFGILRDRLAHHQEVVGILQHNGIKGTHVPLVGFVIDRPQITVYRDHGNRDVFKYGSCLIYQLRCRLVPEKPPGRVGHPESTSGLTMCGTLPVL